MLLFKENLKIYLFKEKQKVSFSIKVSDSCVNTYELSIDHFEKILNNWKNVGIEEKFGNAFWSIFYKKTTPRPEKLPTSYVRISVSMNEIQFNHRVSYSDMLQLEKEYFYQKHNKMYWD